MWASFTAFGISLGAHRGAHNKMTGWLSTRPRYHFSLADGAGALVATSTPRPENSGPQPRRRSVPEGRQKQRKGTVEHPENSAKICPPEGATRARVRGGMLCGRRRALFPPLARLYPPCRATVAAAIAGKGSQAERASFLIARGGQLTSRDCPGI